MSFGKKGAIGGAVPAATRRPAKLANMAVRDGDRRAFVGDDLAPPAAAAEATAPARKKRSLFPVLLAVAMFWPLAQMWMMNSAQRDLETQLGKPDENGLYPAVEGALKPPTTTVGVTRRDPPGKIVDMLAGDPDIAAARAKARASLDTFWARLAAPAPGEDNFTLKASLPTRNGSLEHIWVAHLKRDGDTISGLLSNEPRDIEGMKMGSKVTFHEQQISDWSFRRNGKIVGNETMRPLIAKLPPAEAAQYRQMLETP
jgi:uncharacterized protein YegJ (DUF2314 family)